MLARIYDCLTSAMAARRQGQRLYAELLPLLTFLMASMDTFLVYGKQVLGERLGLDEREPRTPYSHTDALRAQARYAITPPRSDRFDT